MSVYYKSRANLSNKHQRQGARHLHLHHHTGGMFSRGRFRGTTTVSHSRSPCH
ncbi:hypothetical protein JAAARDRAFT_39970 [Jaapia argillacea MUCL 33604]|uniref:Uncharacterized protein n=1 Tax=Jaapia argillacea MUCL 33604 TaxID=933084 RepID=A0A067PD35_9AGAM|nr:hypothetical protein JAAARDRAFT_39970 [Jaapia argillacea MUCL 33604]